MTYIPQSNIISGVDGNGDPQPIRVDSEGRLLISPLLLRTQSGEEGYPLITERGELLTSDATAHGLSEEQLLEIRKQLVHMELITDTEVKETDISHV